MNNELRIEHYLLQLDRELRALPVSQRAEIITEIKSHIYSVLEKDPQRDVVGLLADMGQPTTVAERYLASKGIDAPVPSRARAWVKWLAIGMASCIALVVISSISLVWYLSPLVKVDKGSGRVVLLGGLIDVNEAMGKVKVGGLEVNSAVKDGVNKKGAKDLSGQNITMIKVPFNTAKLDVTSTNDGTMTWDCQSATNAPLEAEAKAGILTLNLDALNMAKCSIGLPRGTASQFTGVNGHMDIESPADTLNVAITNGKVNVKPDPSRAYNFTVSVKNGMQDTFPRSLDKDAVRVTIDVVNGLVKKD
jgi:hypothetical protein